jgi:hypothetical protein
MEYAMTSPLPIQHAEPGSASPTLLPTELVQYVALLAGLGSRSQQLVNQLASICEGQATTSGRTCIDAGNTLMFSLYAPGERGLRVLLRQGPTVDGATPWLRVHQPAHGTIDYLHTETYIGEPPAAWQHTLAAAQLVGGEQRLLAYQAILGTHGRIYSSAWSVADSAPYASVSWQLDRRTALLPVLAACGIDHGWRLVSEHLQALFGQPPGTIGPWSIQLTLHSAQPCIRIGTTRWARMIEHPTKRRRFSALVEQVGGDARFAEALYKLIESAAPNNLATRIGRAVELAVVGDQVTGIEFYLSLP